MFRYKIILLSIFLTACASSAQAMQPVTKVVDLNDFVFTPTGEAKKTATLTSTVTPVPATPPGTLLPLITATRTPVIPPSLTASRTPVIPPTLTESATPNASSTPVATITPSSTPTLSYAVTPLFCQEPGGLVIPENINSTILGYKVAMRVYLPPCYKDYAERRFPVLYLIHGLNQNERSWNEVGADKTAATMIATGKIPPFIIVMPEEKTQDDKPGEFGKVFISEIIPYVDANYRTINDRKYRAIGGLSRGGGWTVNIGFQNPEKFGAIGLHSPAVFYGDDTKLPIWIKNVPPGMMPRVYLDVGEDDILLESVKWVHNIFAIGGVRHEYFVNKGTHIISYWRENLPAYLKWYTTGW